MAKYKVGDLVRTVLASPHLSEQLQAERIGRVGRIMTLKGRTSEWPDLPMTTEIYKLRLLGDSIKTMDGYSTDVLRVPEDALELVCPAKQKPEDAGPASTLIRQTAAVRSY